MRMKTRWLNLSLIVVTAGLSALLIGSFGFGHVDIVKRPGEPATTALTTSTAPLYSTAAIVKRLNHYDDFAELIVPGNDQATAVSETAVVKTFAVQPGLTATRTVNTETGARETCTGMTPQGVTPAGQYLLTTAYDHYKNHNSVLYVQDLNTHRLIKTVVLPGQPHVGGVAYDSTHHEIWLCGRKDGAAALFGLTMTQIERYQESHNKPISYDQVATLGTISRASFVTFHNNSLYVGLFKPYAAGYVQRYTVSKNGIVKGDDSESTWSQWRVYTEALTSQHLLRQIQGFALYRGYALLSQSFGKHNSRLYIFKAGTGTYRQDQALAVFNMPPHLEQISASQGKLYMVFEGAAHAYRHRSGRNFDRIATMDIGGVIDYFKAEAKKAAKAKAAKASQSKAKASGSKAKSRQTSGSAATSSTTKEETRDASK